MNPIANEQFGQMAHREYQAAYGQAQSKVTGPRRDKEAGRPVVVKVAAVLTTLTAAVLLVGQIV